MPWWKFSVPMSGGRGSGAALAGPPSTPRRGEQRCPTPTWAQGEKNKTTPCFHSTKYPRTTNERYRILNNAERRAPTSGHTDTGPRRGCGTAPPVVTSSCCASTSEGAMRIICCAIPRWRRAAKAVALLSLLHLQWTFLLCIRIANA
jgi:hypothetical protein